MTETGSLSVITVNYNDRDNLEKCLESLKSHSSYPRMQVIVVDNASTDGSQKIIEQHFPEIRIIQNDENEGFGRANNRGIKESTGEFILLINTDAQITPDALDGLIDEMRSDAQIGAAAPALKDDAGNFQVSFGAKRNFRAEFIQKLYLNRRMSRKIARMTENQEVLWLSAACLLLRRSALEEVEFFDENFFLYFEDIDLCYRLNAAGWKTIFIPRIQAYHKGGGTTQALKAASRYYYRKSQIYFYRKHNPKISLILLRIYLRINFWILDIAGFFRRGEDFSVQKNFHKLLKH